MRILSLQHILKAKDTRFHNYMLLNFEAEVKSLRPMRGYKAETEAEPKILASRPVWSRGFNVSDSLTLNISETVRDT